MKKMIFSNSLQSFALLLAFSFIFQTSIFAQKKVRGSGNVTTVEHDVKPFTVLELDGVFNVVIEQGDKESVTVETDDNLQELVRIENRGSTLIVDTPNRINIKKSKRMNIYVTITDLERLNISGVGNVESANLLKLGDFELRVKSVGNVDLELDAKYLDARMNSVGNISLSGKMEKADIDNGGVGNLDAYDLENEILNLKSSGVGRTEVYASKEISIRSSGVGNVYYKGDAVITDLNVKGVGKVKKN